MKMKIPTSGSGNGYYGHESSLGYVSPDDSENGHQDDLDSPTLDGDFSEYMWMENEEEFDKQVMQQLEEEALMEHCFEAMLEDEREIRNMPYAVIGANGFGDICEPWNAAAVAEQTENGSDNICCQMESLRVQDQDELAKQSTLNPNAAEFVPQRPLVTPVTEKTS